MGWKALRTVAGRRRLALARRIPLIHRISYRFIINWHQKVLGSPLQHFVIVRDGVGGEESGVVDGRWERALQKLAARRKALGP
jgi:hypothetical protein